MLSNRLRKSIFTFARSLLVVWFGVLALAMPLHSQEIDWIRQFGTANLDQVWGVAKDSNGVYVVGRTDGSLPGQTNVRFEDAFIRKYDANGTELWTRQFGTLGGERAKAVATDATGVYVAGWTFGSLSGQPYISSSDVFVRKYDANGTEVWTRMFGSALGGASGQDEGLGIAVNSTGVYVVGFAGGNLGGTGAGSRDAFVRKYDSNGTEQWTRQFGTTGDDQAWAVALDATGVYVTGYTAGALTGTNAGGYDAFVRKYDVNGNALWTRQFGTPGDDGGQGMTANASGAYAVGIIGVGGALPGQTSAGSRDAFVRKYDANGSEQWTRQFGTTGNDESLGAYADGDSLYVSGNANFVLPGVPSGTVGHVYVRKYDTNGTERATRQFGAGGAEYGAGITADGTGIYVAGYTNGPIPGQTFLGSYDAFLARLTVSSPVPAGINAADEFSLNSNPNGPWSYGYSATLGGAFVLFDTNAVASGFQEWLTSSNPYFGVYGNSTTAPLPWYTASVPPDQLLLHPGQQGQYSMVRWTAPASGTYQIAGSFRGLNVNIAPTTDVHIRLNSATSLFTANISTYNEPQSFALTQTVSAGDTIDFAVGFGSNGTYFNDGTGLQLTISSGQAGCTYSITPTSGSIGSAGGTGSVSVNTQSECSWTASSSTSFMSITSGSSGNGSGSVTYSVEVNSGAQRTGALTIAGKTFTLTQDGAGGCTYTLSLTSQPFFDSGGTGRVEVTTGSGCAWTAVSNSSFLTITSGTSGSGNGSVSCSVAANSGAQRTGTLTIAGQVFTVSQAAATPTLSLSLSPESFRLFGFVGGPVQRQALQIGTSIGTVSWQATANVLNGTGWLTVSPPSGTATSSLPSRVTVEVNFGAFSEPGTYQAVTTIGQAGGGILARIPVTVVVSPAGSRLLLSQSSFLFRTIEGGTAPSQDLRILNRGQGDMNWTIQSQSNRVTLSSLSGTASGGTRGSSTTLSVNTAGLAPGVYQDLLRISAPGAANNPQLVTATLHVAPASATAEPELSAHGILLTIQQSTVDIPSFNLRVRNAGGGTASYQLQTITESGGNWLAVSSTGGSLGTQAARVTVIPSLVSITPGVYRGRIVATFTPGGTREVEVVLVFADVPVIPLRGIPGAAACAPDSMELVVTSVGNGSVVPVSFPRTLHATVVDSCGNLLDDATVVATVEGRNITLSPIGDGFYSGTWAPEREAASTEIVFTALHPTYERVDRPVTVSTTPAAGGVSLPVLFPDGVVEGAAFTSRRPLAPGGIVSLFGADFATADAASTSLPLESSLGGVSVEIGGEVAPLYFAGSGQINAQVPYSVQPGNDVPVVVTVNGLSAPPQTYQIAPAEPGIFLAGEGGAILDSQSQLVTAENPAERGEVLQIFATGLGETNPPGQTGEAAPSSSQVLLPVTVKVGGVDAPVQYQGLAPGFVGLYQVNVQLPTTVAPGDNVEVVILQNGIPSNPDRPATISVR